MSGLARGSRTTVSCPRNIAYSSGVLSIDISTARIQSFDRVLPSFVLEKQADNLRMTPFRGQRECRSGPLSLALMSTFLLQPKESRLKLKPGL